MEVRTHIRVGGEDPEVEQDNTGTGAGPGSGGL